MTAVLQIIYAIITIGGSFVNILKLKIFSVVKNLFVVFVSTQELSMKFLFYLAWFVMTASLVVPNALAFEPTSPECLAPAKQGGGIHLTCELAAKSLLAANLIDVPMTVNFKPGGIGAIAYNYVVGVKSDAPSMIVAASSGSALNLAIKKFGRYGVEDVRWLGALGTDYGMIAVPPEAPWNDLNELINDLTDGKRIVFGGGGSIGSQDWMKIALLVREAGIDPRSLRYVAFEGGGEALSAFTAGVFQVFSGDVSEIKTLLNLEQLKVLAVLAPERLSGKLASIPTASEQGYPINWPVWRGFYMGPDVSDEAFNWWVNTFRRLVKTREFAEERRKLGLYPFFMVGDAFDHYVQGSVKKHHQTAVSIGLINE